MFNFRKTKIALLISLLFFGLFFVFTKATNAEVIKNFDSVINVLPDSSLLVNEKINYDFETSLRHGIFRNIILSNAEKEPIEIRVVSVKNENGDNYNFTQKIINGTIKIQIGDPDVLISGEKEYNISYQVFGGVTYFEDFDEVYWNATGNDWTVPILKSTAIIVLPNNVFPINKSCYIGPEGSTTKCNITETNVFDSGKELSKGEGLTVAASFPKGTVSVYQRKTESLFVQFVKIFWPILIPVSIFIILFIRWYKKGRDPKGTGVIIPQYDVPEELTPLEVGTIIKEKIKNENISAEIIYLATEGYIKIKKTSEKILGIIPKKDYEFTLLKEDGLLKNEFDRKIIIAMFEDEGEVGGVATLSTMNNRFYRSIPVIKNSIIDSLISKKYFTNFPKAKFGFVGSVIAFIFFTNIFSGVATHTNYAINSQFAFVKSFVLINSVLISIIIAVIFYRIMPARSKKGVYTMEYLLGLKEYLQIAEKDRLHFHNAPEKNPEIFEKLLPYAMVFGVEELWAKEFEGIYINKPGWYDDGSSSFSAVSFGRDMALFSSLTTNSVSSSPNSGGSGGGGSSGGGGGGGGGGSW